MTEDNQHIRRSSRSTKGKNTRLNYEQELENENILKRKLVSNTVAAPKAKKPKLPPKDRKSEVTSEIEEDEEDEEEEDQQPIDDSDDDFVGSDTETNGNKKMDDDNLEETVRCLVCGATDENYDEDTDKLGLMVECSKCQTWQHSKCLLGHKNPKKVPDDYVCNVCDPLRYPNLQLKLNLKQHQQNKKSKKEKPTVEKKLSFNKIRLSVAKTFHKLFLTLIPKQTTEGVAKSEEEIDRLAQSYSIDLEQLIFNNYSVTKSRQQPPGHKYSEKSRSLYANLKDTKNILFKQILENKLTMNELTLMSPQELLNPDLQKFSKQVMEQLIHDSVLKPMQKPTFKKTHKGDELVEEEYNADVEVSSNVGLVFNHKKEESPKLKTEEESSTQPTDREESEEPSHRPSLINLNSPIELDEIEQTHDYEDVGLDDDLDNILNDDTKQNDKEEKEETNVTPFDKEIWNGELTFPGICNFQSKLEFISTTNNSHSIDKELQSTKIIMDNFSIKNLLEIDGRLSADKLISYLTKILKSRYLNVCNLKHVEDESNFQRLFNYFNNRSKVGVIGNRPDFVKDCYLLTFSQELISEIKNSRINDQVLNTLLNSFKSSVFGDLQIKDTILIVFVIKPNFSDDLNKTKILQKLPNNFYKLTSSNQQKFMDIIELSEKNGKLLSESEVENLVRNLMQ